MHKPIPKKNKTLETEYKEALENLKNFLIEKKEEIIKVITKDTYNFLIKDLIEQIDNKYNQPKIINFLDIRQRFFNVKIKLENDFNDPIITIYDEKWFIDLKKEFKQIFEKTAEKINELYKKYIKNGVIE